MGADTMTYELNKGETPSIFQLLALQASVAEAMERKWFAEYVRHLTVKEEAEKVEEEEMRLTCSTTSVRMILVISSLSHTFTHFFSLPPLPSLSPSLPYSPFLTLFTQYVYLPLSPFS